MPPPILQMKPGATCFRVVRLCVRAYVYVRVSVPGAGILRPVRNGRASISETHTFRQVSRYAGQ